VNRNLVTAFGAIASSRLAIIFISVAFSPLLIRLLGFGTYGTYATLIAMFDLLMIPVSSGINSGVRKYISEDRDTAQWKSYVFAYYFRLALVLALVAALVLVASAVFGLVAWVYEPAYTPYVYLLAVLVIASQLREYTRRTLMGLQLEHLGEPLNVVFRAVFAIVALALAALGFGVAGVFVSQIIASLLVFAIAIVLVSRHLSLTTLIERVPTEYPTTEMFRFNHKTIVYIFLLTSLYKVDQIMVGSLAGSTQAGYYRAALVLAGFLWFLPRSFQSLMLQSTSDHWANERIDTIEELATRSTRYVLLVTLLLAIGLGALAPVVVPLYYGAGATPVVLPLLVLLPGTVGFAVARPLLTITHAKGDMLVLIAATGVAAGINFVLNAVLIPPYGMIGAALATTIGYGSLPLFQVYGARYIGYRPFREARLPQIGITALLSGLVITGMAVVLGSITLADLGITSLWMISRTPIALIIVPPVGFVLYSGLAIATGAIEIEEIVEILDRIPISWDRWMVDTKG
jgi:O-antigen/teichoic acid export membrane protein